MKPNESPPLQRAVALSNRAWRSPLAKLGIASAALLLVSFLVLTPAVAQPAVPSVETAAAEFPANAQPPMGEAAQGASPQQLVDEWTGRAGLSSTLKIMLLLSLVSLAPAFLLMTTSFVRIVVVLGLLRQALGTQQLPPTQIVTSLAMFLSLLIMTPVWRQVYDEAVAPYNAGEIDLDQAWRRGQVPIRKFMAAQIERTGNTDDVYLFLDYIDPPPSESEETAARARPTYVYVDAREERGERDVPLAALLPAFMLSELKTAFVIGFQIFLPFVVLDLVVAAVMSSMGMMMLPPVLISLPFKLLLFVLVDGWHLVVEMLLMSFGSSG